ncbi:MAG: SiaB family protein kinase [Bacteroidota bacterium]
MGAPESDKLRYVYDLFGKMSRYDMNYLYHGDFSPSLTDSILSFAESSLTSIGESVKMRKKVYFIMVESLQNITRHQEAGHKPEGSSFFIIQGVQNGYFITSGNHVASHLVPNLRSRLDMVNSLDPANLKAYSQELLEAGALSQKGGAGLGLIEMARRSGNKLHYDFVEQAKDISFFYYQIKVFAPESNGHANYSDSFEFAQELHRLLIARNINIVYQGGFSNENVSGVLQMIEGSFAEKNSDFLSKQVFSVIVELLHNIYEHADSFEIDAEAKPGMFLIGMEGNDYVITTGNLVLTSKTEALHHRIEKLNNLGEADLKRMMSEVREKKEIAGKVGSEFGLEDIRTKCSGKIVYSMQPVNERYSFFTMQVRITDK